MTTPTDPFASPSPGAGGPAGGKRPARRSRLPRPGGPGGPGGPGAPEGAEAPARRRPVWRWVLAGLVLVVAPLVALSACSLPSTASDETALHYGGGPIESKRFKNCIPASTRNIDGPYDTYYYYPESQRVFDFTGADAADSPPISVVSSDNQTVTVPGTIQFNLNTDCQVLQRFHDNIGRRYQAYMVEGGNGEFVTSDGWARVLNLYIGRAADATLDRVAKRYTWRQLYSDPAIKDELNREVNETVAQLVDQQTDGDDVFFQDYSALIGQPTLTEELAKALRDEEAAVAAAQAARAAADAQVATKNAEVAVAEAEARRQAAEIAPFGSAQEYNNFRAIEQGLNPYQPVYGGAAVVPVPEQ